MSVNTSRVTSKSWFNGSDEIDVIVSSFEAIHWRVPDPKHSTDRRPPSCTTMRGLLEEEGSPLILMSSCIAAVWVCVCVDVGVCV